VLRVLVGALGCQKFEEMPARRTLASTLQGTQVRATIERTHAIRRLPAQIGEWLLERVAETLVAERDRLRLGIGEEPKMRTG